MTSKSKCFATLAIVLVSCFGLTAQNLCPAGTIPSGHMEMYFQPKPSGGCAAWQGLNNPPTGASQFALPALDANGAYSVSGGWMTGTQGDYCIYVYYSGDTKCAETNLVPTIITVGPPPFKGPVTITLVVTPNPLVQNQSATFSGSVVPAP